MNSARSHVPERTCIACRQTKPKSEFVRLVRSVQGQIEVDQTAKGTGRGAYLCKSKECWESVFATGRKDRLMRALGAKASPENRAALVRYGMTFPSAKEVAERGLK